MMKRLILAAAALLLLASPSAYAQMEGGGGLGTSAISNLTGCVSPKQFGAVGNGVHNDTVAMDLVGATGLPICGGGLTYAYSGNWTPTSDVISDITIKQLAPNFDGRRTLLKTSCPSGYTILTNVKVLRNGASTDAGNENDNFGIDLQCSGALVYLNAIEVSGGGPGTLIAVIDAAYLYYNNVYAHDAQWASPSDPGSGGELIVGLDTIRVGKCNGNGINIKNLTGLTGSSTGAVPSFTATISGTTMTVSAVAAGTTLDTNQRVVGAGVAAGTIITVSDAGHGAGTYTLNKSSTVAVGETMTSPARAYQTDAVDTNGTTHCTYDNVVMENTGEGWDVSGSAMSDDVHMIHAKAISIDSDAFKIGSATNSSAENSVCEDAGFTCGVLYSNNTTPAVPTNNRLVNLTAVHTGSNGFWNLSEPDGFQVLFFSSGAPGAQTNAQLLNLLAWDDASTMLYGYRIDTGVTLGTNINSQSYGAATNFAKVAGSGVAGFPIVPTATSGTFGVPALGGANVWSGNQQFGSSASRNIVLSSGGALTQTFGNNGLNTSAFQLNNNGITAAAQGSTIEAGCAQSGTPTHGNCGAVQFVTLDTYAAAGSSSSKIVLATENAGSAQTTMTLNPSATDNNITQIQGPLVFSTLANTGIRLKRNATELDFRLGDDSADASAKMSTIILSAVANASGNEILCYATATGAVTYEPAVATCVPSALRFKIPFDTVSLELASDRLDNLHAAVWTYKDKAMWGERPYVGLYADDVAKMDPRCVDYDKDGKLANYEDRCVIAYLVATVQHQKKQIAQLQRKRQ